MTMVQVVAQSNQEVLNFVFLVRQIRIKQDVEQNQILQTPLEGWSSVKVQFRDSLAMSKRSECPPNARSTEDASSIIDDNCVVVRYPKSVHGTGEGLAGR